MSIGVIIIYWVEKQKTLYKITLEIKRF